MFRKPRSPNASAPSVGRPPSPPPTPSPFTKALPPKPKSDVPPPEAPKIRVMASTAKQSPNGGKVPIIGRQGPTKNGRVKQPAQANGSILNFFKKKDGQPGSNDSDYLSETLFVEDDRNGSPRKPTGIIVGLDNGAHQEDACTMREEELARFNEAEVPIKRRKLSPQTELAGGGSDINTKDKPADVQACTPPPEESDDDDKSLFGQDNNRSEPDANNAIATAKTNGPFMEDSESEDEEVARSKWHSRNQVHDEDEAPTEVIAPAENSEVLNGNDPPAEPPPLSRQSTSFAADAGFDEFDEMGDFDDEYEDGDEAVERRYAQEQMRLERLAAEGHFEGDYDDDDFTGNRDDPSETATVKIPADNHLESSVKTCPICDINFEGVSDQDASVHVNNCLDGNPTPLPTRGKSHPDTTSSDGKETGHEITTMKPKFQRPVRAARPGQANPFQLGRADGVSSAFSKLMSGHAEDAAWADAAAAENASRGKPSYQRTCPFYKILPGFFICVDAFRYGAVQGCKAYFLSHFHSDHYVGLHASWCHGPIYCSRPTANLVKQQLRVDAKYVVALEWEKRTEVPGSQGVYVTMIPANHCPGSSLYLFEKVVGKGANPKIQRVLHCGDFRACPAHVEHPLLKPEVMDAVSGKTFQQKIDVCYLDTTYLNPKYAFPSQEDVIQACADMCVSLNKTKVDETDGWEQMKRERAGSAMANFVRKDSKDGEAGSKDATGEQNQSERGGLLVVVGTYSIGKERICLGIARALKSKIYAPAGKQRICAALEDEELNARLTSDPREAQVHMTPLFEIRAETLADYLAEYRDRFKRAVGFRPTGWNYRPPGSRFTESPSVGTVLYSDNWKSSYTMKDLMPQRGSTSTASCFGVPYSEHSSFRELSMFCCALRIDKIIPTVNIGSAKSRERMKLWCERWATERKKNGLFKLYDKNGKSEWFPGGGTWELRTTL